MDAHKLWMLRDFIGTNKVLFRIPVYQRNYDWSESNCNRLLDDIYGIMQSSDKHFLGTIVFMAAKSGGFALQEYIIIDGQQRLTTLMLILKALSAVAESVGDDCYHEIEEQYLHNKYCDEEFKVKLKPIKSDNNQFLLLLEDKIDEMDEDTHIYHNFMLFDDSIEFEYIETLTLDSYDEVTGKKLVSFKLFGETYRQNKYALMLLDVIKLLDKKIPGKLQTLAENNYSFNSTKRKHVHLNLDGSGMRWPWKVTDGIYLEANLSAWSCIRFIENLLAEFGFEKDQFSFNIVAEEPSETDEDEE